MQRYSKAGDSLDLRTRSFVFEDYTLIPAQKLLLHGDVPISIGARAFDLLVTLVCRAGEMVSKDDLLAQAWPGLSVEEGNLRVHITALRKALGEGQSGKRYIVNSPGRGYSFVAPVIAAPVARPDAGTSTRTGEIRAPAGNLPPSAVRIVGRDHLVDLIAASLPERRFVTISGSGGIGKTTVALAVANTLRASYRNGVYLVDLAPLSQAALVASALAEALGLPVNTETPIHSLLSVLRDKAILLVLDNCEHVIESAAALIHELYCHAPGVHILATSRQPLRVAGEYVQRLPALELPPAIPHITAKQALNFAAICLFVERVSALLGNFELSDEDAPIVALICRRLDGIALAIELAAARVDTLGIRGLVERLDDRFRLLKRGPRTAHSRHQTLRATFDWSYDLLPDAARIVLRRLAVFAGQFTLASAVAVAGFDMDEADIADEFTTLVSASLLAVDLAANPVTYRLLESTRAYALERLAESGEQPVVARKHADRFLNLLGDVAATSSTWSNAKWVSVHGHQLDNLRVALDWTFAAEGDPELGIALTIAAIPLWQRLSLIEECRVRTQWALARLDPGDDRRMVEAMQLHMALGNALAFRSESESSAAFEKALSIAELIGDTASQVAALRGLWGNAYSVGNWGSAELFAGRLAALVSPSSAPSVKPMSDHIAGMNAFYVGNLPAAHLHLKRALDAYEAILDNPDVLRFPVERGLVVTGVNVSHLLWLQGRPDQAARMVERSIDMAGSSAHEMTLAFALAYGACRISIETGRYEDAEIQLERLAERVSWDPLGQWSVVHRCWTGVYRARMGDPDAADLLAGALREIPEGNFRLHHTRFLGEWALALCCARKPEQAMDVIERAITASERLGERWFFPELLRFKGEIMVHAGHQGAVPRAEEQFRSALQWAQRQGALAWELRAAVSLARVQCADGRPDEARRQLAPVYDRFSEGFGTVDLQTAKALLDDLA